MMSGVQGMIGVGWPCEELKSSTCKKILIEWGQWMFEASGVDISRAMGIDRGAEMFEVHETMEWKEWTRSRQFRREIGTVLTMYG